MDSDTAINWIDLDSMTSSDDLPCAIWSDLDRGVAIPHFNGLMDKV